MASVRSRRSKSSTAAAKPLRRVGGGAPGATGRLAQRPRQVLLPDLVAVGEENQHLDGVLELPDVAPPGMRLEPLEDRGREPLSRLAVAARRSARGSGRRAAGCRRPARAAAGSRSGPCGSGRRGPRGKLPAATRASRFSLVAEMRRKSTGIVRRPPTRSISRALEGPQELGLDRQREGADLVEKERPSLGQLEPSRPRRDRAGERALLVPEELRLGQRLRQRRGVDGHERPIAPRDSPRGPSAPRAPCPFRSRPRSGPMASLPATFSMSRKRRSIGALCPTSCSKPGAGARGLAQLPVLGEQAAPLERSLEDHQQLGGVHRLLEEVERAERERLEGVLPLAFSRHHHDRRLGVALPRVAKELEPLLATAFDGGSRMSKR